MDPSRWVDAVYEDLLAQPVAELRRLYDALGLTFAAAADRFGVELLDNVARTSLTAPRQEKWREQNPEAIERILPLVADTEQKLGYRTGQQ